MRRFMCLLLSGIMLISMAAGCATKTAEYKAAESVVNNYPNCFHPLKDYQDHANDVTKTTAGGAALGFMGGAVIGFLTTGDWKGALFGGLATATAAGLATNMYAQKQKEKDDNKRLASYLNDIDGDISGLDAKSAAARASLDCYDKSFQTLLEDIRAKRIFRPEAEKRIAEIKAGRQAAIQLLDGAVADGIKMDAAYEEVFNQEEKAMAAKTAQTSVKQSMKATRQRKAKLSAKIADMKHEATVANETTKKHIEEYERITTMLL